MKHGIKTPDGLGLHKVLDADLPEGSTLESLNLWPVNSEIPEGFRQDFSQGPRTARGWQLVDGVVVPCLVEIPPHDNTPAVPESVSRRQLKEWLIRHALLDTVEAIIAGIPDATERRIAQNWWGESIEFRRDHALVAAIAGVIGKTSAEVDTIFRESATL